MAREDRAREDQDAGGAGTDAGDLEGYFYQPHVNQARHEPLPASHSDDRWQDAVRRNEEQHHAMSGGDSPAARGQAMQRLAPGGTRPGPGEPATQIAAADSDEESVSAVRRVTHVAPGRPDGEVNPGR